MHEPTENNPPRPRPPDVEKNTNAAENNSLDEKAYSAFTPWQKKGIVLGAACTALFSPLTAQIYLPALNQLSHDLDVTSTQIDLTLTTYMIFQGITPMFVGSLADSGGRRPAYVVCFVVYLGANVGLALAPSYEALLGLRCLQSAGSSSTVALCMAVVADVVTSAERGQYVGFTAVPSVLGPSLGPILGGLLSQYLGWRAIFWFLAVASLVALVAIVLVFPETCRHVVGDGSVTPPPLYRSVWQQLAVQRRRRRLRRPRREDEAGATPPPPSSSGDGAAARTGSSFRFKPPNMFASLLLLFQKETGLLLCTSSIVFAGFYCVASAMPSLFAQRYGYDDIDVGLMYLPIAVGSIGAAVIVGPAINRNFERHCIKTGMPYHRSRQHNLSRFPIERARLEIGLPLLCLAGASLIGWGWAVHAVAHVAVPCAMSFLVGMGMIGFSNTSNILLVDIHPGKAGTATAANNFARCLVGAGASAAIVPLVDAVGVGPAFTLVGGLYFVCLVPLLVLLRFGIKWRAQANKS